MSVNTEQGRADLCAWREQSSKNFYTDDADLKRTLRTRLSARAFAAACPRLERAGEQVATRLARLAETTNEDENLPRLSRYDALGLRTEDVVFHPAYHEAGSLIWESGVLSDYAEPGGETVQMALLQLFAEGGENGHNCPLACTAGLIKVIQKVGTAEQQEKYLPGLLTRDYNARTHASQFLTEIQGGSDVGSNSVVATPEGDGFRIHGEKWFCSVADADMFLLTARPEGARDGTRGLGMFLVPRRIQGRVNEFHIRRLKKKLGTRAMASAEIDFRGAWAEPLGNLDEGFKNVVELVLNTSRVFNAVCCAGAMRGAYRVASSYARHRRAFGQIIGEYPLIMETLTQIRAEAMGATASSFRLTALGDRMALGQGSARDAAAKRAGVNINKYWTSVRNTQVLRSSMEVLGGNGAIETFSPMVRLFRDSMVLESWEGAHNVLVEQVLKDSARYQVHQAFIEDLRQSLGELKLNGEASHVKETAENGLNALEDGFQRLSAREGDQRLGRALLDQAGALLQVVALLEEHAACDADPASLSGARVLLRAFVSERIEAPAPLERELL